MDKTLRIQIKEPYGVETIYPVCDVARLFCELLRQKTLTRRDVEVLKRLGYVFEVVTEVRSV